MEPFVTALPTLAVATIFCLYDIARRTQAQRQQTLRERVTWMLWTLAMNLDRIEREAKQGAA